jgi:hypothetical protein
VNLGVARLAIVVALVVGGVAVLANGFTDGATAANPPGSTSPTPSPSASPSQPPKQDVVPNQEGVLVQVLNGTNTAGFAADFQALLTDDNYLKAGEPADAPDKPILDTVVYFRQDANKSQNRADAELLSETYLGGAAVQPLPASYKSLVSESADVIVVLGEDQAGTN